MAYKDLTPKEKYESALRADKEPWHPGAEIKKLIKEKMGMKSAPMPDTVQPPMAPNQPPVAPVAPATPPAPQAPPAPPSGMKKGGKVKAKKMCSGGMAKGGKVKGHGIESKGKTKGRFI